MSYLKKLEAIKRIHVLIRRKSTGSPEELAERLNISRASIFRYIKELKEMGAPVFYSRDRKSYIYERAFELEF